MSPSLRDDPEFRKEVGAAFQAHPGVFTSQRTYYRYWSELEFSPFVWRLLTTPGLIQMLERAVSRAQKRQRSTKARSDHQPPASVYDTSA